MEAKDRKKKYGVTMAPIPCTEAWRREMPFDHRSRGVETWSYILVNRYTGTRTHANVYTKPKDEPGTGPGHNSLKSTYKIKNYGTAQGEKDLIRSLQIGKDSPYSRCRISDCPVASLALPPDGYKGPIALDILYETGQKADPMPFPEEVLKQIAEFLKPPVVEEPVVEQS